MKGGIGTIGKWRNTRMLAGIKPISPAMSLTDEMKSEEEMLASWAARVGDDRAQLALQIWRKRTGSTTLPELLAEHWLTLNVPDFRPQFELEFARPDFILWGVLSDGCMVWRIQGDYWHSRTSAIANDAQQKERLLRHTARGVPIVAVIDIWEKRIYESDAIFTQALRGIEVPR